MLPSLQVDGLRRLLDLLPQPLLLLAADGTIDDANAAACSLLVQSAPALSGLNVRDLVTSSTAAFDRYLESAWRSGSALPGAATLRAGERELRLRLSAGALYPKGSERPTLCLRVQTAEHSPFAILTEKVRTLALESRQHRDAQERLQTTLDGLPVAICVRNEAGRFELTNRAFDAWFGPFRGAPTGALPSDVLAPDAASVVDAAALGAAVPREHLLGRESDGRYVWPVRFDAGTLDGARLVGNVWIDETRRRSAEVEREKMYASVLHAQKLESLGVLAGGIAHDFNNLLVPILGNAELVAAELGADASAAAGLRDIATAAQRAAELCKQMLAYSGKGRFVVRTVDLSDVVREMVALLEVSMDKRVALKLSLATALAAIEVDVTQMRQVVMNLITNASDAIGDVSGIITIGTGSTECSAEYLATMDVGADLAPGPYTWIEVSDTGCGMSAETRAKIFDPFFTTKTLGRGLGLAAVLGIVRGHRAALRIYTEAGRGTTFKVLFPAVEGPAQPLSAATPAPNEWTGNGTVLVVDDEASVREVARRLFARHGFDALVAANGQEALRIFSEHEEIRLVLLDMAMPVMNGEETFRRLRLARPDVRVILCSGYNEQDATNHFLGKGLAGFLQKPYRLAEFIETVRRALQE